MNTPTRRLPLWAASGLLTLVALLGLSAAATARQPDPLTAAVERARAAGSYAFSTDITQVTVPLSKVTNVGRTSSTSQMHLEGQTNLRDQSMQMRLWMDGGSVADPASGVAVKLEDGKTYAQQGLGAWREKEGLVDGFAPEGDPMAFLAALRDPVALPPEARNGIELTRYTFRLDGPALAAYVRDQAEEILRRRGELPTGLQTEAPAYYRDMTGDGELWVGPDGLPLRQILRMRFPEQRDERVQAEIVTDFSRFGEGAGGGAPAEPLVQVRSLAAGLRSRLPGVGGTMGLLALVGAAAIALRRRGRLLHALSAALILMLVVNPLFGQLQTVHAATALAERAATRDQQQAENRQADALRASMARPASDPHADPQKAAPAPTGPATVAPGRTEQFAPPVDDGTDTDKDGLTDYQEARLGTEPGWADTDEDGLGDAAEVKGFTAGGQTWYLNPREADSNGDSVPDGLEYDRDKNGVADDTDGDGAPDVWDDDNDGDGVDDGLDLAPFTASPTPAAGPAGSRTSSETYSADRPLKLKINNWDWTHRNFTFVDFQIRPVNPKHLWFAYNVLDWPSPDDKGQVRDVDGVTFAQLPRAPGESAPGASDYNGDMKLIPMLEIRIPDGAHLPLEADLAPYSISVSDYRVEGPEASNGKVAYVPLSIVTNQRTGARVAFNARMRYRPDGAWQKEHEVRLVWLVQMLNDVPCDFGAKQPAPGCQSDNHVHNVRQVVHSYEDGWVLAGLNVKEDHGAGVAAIYEDPAVDPNLAREEALAALAVGLDETFLVARDLTGPADRRDVDLSEVVRRFDHASNDGVTEDERWAVPDILSVERRDYPTLDQAMMTTAMTETLRILDTRFAGRWAADKSIKPLLMYAEEMRSRGLGMDAVALHDGSATWTEDSLVMDLASAPILTNVSLKWTPYCAPSGATPQWAPCDMDVWWETLEGRYSGVLPGDPDSPVTAAGRTGITNLVAGSLMLGVNRVVEQDGHVVSANYTMKGDGDIAGYVKMGLAVPRIAVSFLLNSTFMKPYEKTLGIINVNLVGEWKEALANSKASTGIANLWHSGISGKVGVIGAAAGMLLLLGAGAYAVYYFGGDAVAFGMKVAIKAIVIAASAVFNVYATAQSFLRFIQLTGATFGQAARAYTEVISTARGVTIIGAVISVLATWGFFIGSILFNNVDAGSPTFTAALAETIAATIYILLTTILSLIVIGLLIVAIIGFIDLVLTSICELGVDWLRSLPGMGGACLTIGTGLTKLLAWAIHNYSPMVNLELPNLIVMSTPQLDLADANKGYSAGQTFTVVTAVTTTVVHQPPPVQDSLMYVYGVAFYSENNLRSSTFKHSLSAITETIPSDWNQMSGQWKTEEVDDPWGLGSMWRGQASAVVTSTGISLAAGLDRPLAPILNTGYTVPAYECWGILVLGVCYVRKLNGNFSEKIELLQYDIFPDTLDGFMELTPRESGFALKWDSRFPPLADADGDGLLRRNAQNPGLDPDDSTWDRDRDGLSDTFELEQGQHGAAYSTEVCDTDGDDLTDRQEAQFGTAPDRPDTDGDGLNDGDEVVHQAFGVESCLPEPHEAGGWLVTVAGVGESRVGSDPLLPDSDGDGLWDDAERDLAQDPDPARRLDTENRPFHPAVANTPWISVRAEGSRDKLRPGDTIAYTTTVVTRLPLYQSPVEVSWPEGLGSYVPSYMLPFDPLAFTGAQTVTWASELHTIMDIASQPSNIKSTVWGQIAPGGPISSTQPYIAVGHLPVRVDAVPPHSWLDAPGPGQYVRGDAESPMTTIIGGGATDSPTGIAADSLTGIARVEVSVDGGAWQTADGSTTWTYPLLAQEGAFVIRTRATDGAGNVETPGPGTVVLLDGRPPEFSFSDQPAQPVVPRSEADGRWTVAIGGSVQDPQIAGQQTETQPGSGVAHGSLRLRLHSAGRETPVIGEWRPVSSEGDSWYIEYTFPASVSDPTGAWVAEMSAADNVGNIRQEKAPAPFSLDIAPPVVTLNQDVLVRNTLSGRMDLGGVISDTVSGVDGLDLSFTPLDQVVPLRDAALWLSFDEPAGATYFEDHSGQGNAARCGQAATPAAYCPLTHAEGRTGRGLVIAPPSPNPGYAVVRDVPGLNIAGGAGFSAMAWIKVRDRESSPAILSKGSAYSLRLQPGGSAEWTMMREDMVFLLVGGEGLNNGEWHHLAITVDDSARRLYVDGNLAQEGLGAGSDFSSTADLMFGSPRGSGYDLAIDEVIFLRHAASPEEVRALAAAADPIWYPATLAQRGPGVAQTTWTLALPENLEGVYQMDLRGQDMLGNNRIRANAWRGTVDTRAPRVRLTATPTGAAYTDPISGPGRAAYRYRCAAQDTFLDDERFRCSGANLSPARRSFDDDPILRTVFPDLTVRDGLLAEWTRWEAAGPLRQTAQACDLLGNCATDTVDLTVQVPYIVLPTAVVTAPETGATIASNGTLSVTVAARTIGAMYSITLELDGAVVATTVYDRSDSISAIEQPFTVTASEGNHTLVARVAEWSPREQTATFPVTITLDTHPPEVAVATTKITGDEVYHRGSPVVRFHGSASDTVCLAAVQLRVGNDPFVDTTLANGEWSTAYFVNAPEGQTLTVTARAIDCAGQAAEVIKVIPTDLTPADAPDTEITARPHNPSATEGVTFAFRGVKRSRDVAGLMCRLDDAMYTPCASPLTYNGLGQGQHTFSVRAIDVEGWVDGSPATHTWNVRLLTYLPLVLRGR